MTAQPWFAPATYTAPVCGEVKIIGSHYYECVAPPHDTVRKRSHHYFTKDPLIVVPDHALRPR